MFLPERFCQQLMRLPGAEVLFAKEASFKAAVVYGGAVRNFESHSDGEGCLEAYIRRGGDIDVLLHVDDRSYAFQVLQKHRPGWKVQYKGCDYHQIPGSPESDGISALYGWYRVTVTEGDLTVAYDLNVNRSIVALNVVPDYTVNGLAVSFTPYTVPRVYSLSGVDVAACVEHIVRRVLVAVARPDEKRVARGLRLCEREGYTFM